MVLTKQKMIKLANTMFEGGDPQLSFRQDKTISFNAMYEKHRSAMLLYAGKRVSLEIAEDLVHDVFMKIWNNWKDIEVGEQFSGYLFKSLRHGIINYMAKGSNGEKYVAEFTAYEAQYALGSTDENLREQLFLKNIMELLQHFSPRHRVLFKLRIDGYTNQEIGAKLGISEKTVRNQYSIMLKYLRDRLPILILLLLRF